MRGLDMFVRHCIPEGVMRVNETMRTKHLEGQLVPSKCPIAVHRHSQMNETGVRKL